jgi:solute:Na+ symporter, SSS family
MTLGLLDTLFLLVSLAIAIWIGVRSGRRNDSAESFMLGGRDLPWWAILGSIVATETSTATVLSLPATGYGPVGMKFLQITFGYFIGRLCVIQILLPLFFQGKLFSAYEVLRKRFGTNATHAASLLFLVTRNLGDGLRLFLAALVVQKLMGWDFYWSAIAIGVITIFYTYLGGMRSVIWNDCIQLVIYMAGGVATVFVIVSQIDGGWASVFEYARQTGKLEVIQWKPPSSEGGDLPWWQWLMTDAYSLWAGLIGGAVLTLGTHGTDQMMVQRYLSARSRSDAGWAVFWSSIVVFVQFALFLFIGVQLACYYDQNPPIAEFAKSDEVYAHFLIHSFPKGTGLIGLMLAAILAAAMSTLSSSLNSSATAVINDFYLPACRQQPSQESLFSLTRWLSIGFGVLQVGIGILATGLSATVVQSALTIAGYSAGLLLGLFLLGVATRKVSQSSALQGAVIGLICLLCVQFVLPLESVGGIRIAWPWFALIGSATTFLSACLLSLAKGE